MTCRSTGVRTQQEVADELGLTRARIMQIEQKALRKIRKALGLDEAGRVVVKGARGKTVAL